MATDNELYEALAAAKERCQSCRFLGRNATDFPLCQSGLKWRDDSVIVSVEDVTVYPGDLYYFYEHYDDRHPPRGRLASHDAPTRNTHALVGKCPCPLYRRDGA